MAIVFLFPHGPDRGEGTLDAWRRGMGEPTAGLCTVLCSSRGQGSNPRPPLDQKGRKESRPSTHGNRGLLAIVKKIVSSSTSQVICCFVKRCPLFGDCERTRGSRKPRWEEEEKISFLCYIIFEDQVRARMPKKWLHRICTITSVRKTDAIKWK